MSTEFSFEIVEIQTQGAVVVLRNGGKEFRASVDAQVCSDGLRGFLRAVTDLVSDRLWGAICYWAGDQGDGWLVDLRECSDGWLEITVFPEGEWPTATDVRIPVFQARIDNELDLARVVATAYASVRERYGTDQYRDRWGHLFPQTDLDELHAWIATLEQHAELIDLQIAINQQIAKFGRSTPADIAAVLGESPERVTEIINDMQRQYDGPWDLVIRPRQVPY